MTTKQSATLTVGLLLVALATAPAFGEEPSRGMRRSNDHEFDITSGLPSNNTMFVSSANGLQQVPAVLTPGRAFFRARIIDGGEAMEFELRYDLAGPLQAAMLHIGQAGAVGAPAVPLCVPSQPGTGTVQVCPDENIGSFSGMIIASDILPAAAGQGVNDLATLYAAMMARITYVEVWTGLYDDHGEVRGQVAPLRASEGGGSLGDSPGTEPEQDLQP